MPTATLPRVSASVSLSKAALERLFDNLRSAGYTLVGPVARDGAIVLDVLSDPADLPAGWADEQQPGKYRLKWSQVEGLEPTYFDYAVGPHSWKKFLFPARAKLLKAVRHNGNWSFEPAEEPPPRYAFIGVRACDLAAIQILDRVFLNTEFRDPRYEAVRREVFVLAVHCTHPSSSCFCTSMKTGPRATSGFDLALTELPDGFVAEVGSEVGSSMLLDTGWESASAFDLGRATQALQQAERVIERQVRTDDLPRLLYDNLDHPRWDHVAARCLACGNCTMACPTCFCSTVEDSSNLRGTTAERTRVWDSCFNLDFSHVHGGNLRPSTRARYRQWLTHKFASWLDQFGSLGCVGCGRCITWCPVGIDLTEELKAFRAGGTR